MMDNVQLARETILRQPTPGIPAWLIHPMEWRMIDRLASVPEGSYERDPVNTYRRMLVACGVCMVDQWIPMNPLTMGAHGYESDTVRRATTGAEEIVLDGMAIFGPDDVVKHMERFLFPSIETAIAEFDEDDRVARMIAKERCVQNETGTTMLKAPYMQLAAMPCLAYDAYGYANYFMAYALYPDVVARHFQLQADHALLVNRAGARAMTEGNLPKYVRLDHDMADSRGTLVDIKTLDDIWFPRFSRCIQPFLDANVTLIWHCDGNLSQMAPRLLECGLKGFQGFQYEDGMDYEKICRMKDRNGDDLLIIAGVSVTRTLPHGTSEDVRKEMKWLVDNGPKQGLFLGASSSITPGVSWENLNALRDGFKYYREHGRN